NRVAPDRRADRVKCAGPAQRACKRRIGRGFTARHRTQRTPHLLLERRAFRCQRYLETRRRIGKISLELSSCRAQYGSFVLTPAGARADLGKILLPLEPAALQ